MKDSYRHIIEQLVPYKNKVFLLPLTEEELSALENLIGQFFPDYFREFLLTFGIRQDFVFELAKNEREFISGYKYLPAALKKQFIPIGGSPAGGGIWLLNTLDPADRGVYEIYREIPEQVTPLNISFDDLIQQNITELATGYASRELNSEKNWHVQFSISTNDEQSILDTLDAIRTKEWIKEETTSAGVHCYQSEIAISSTLRRFSRSEYKDWKAPSYWFNFSEPALSLAKGSLIKLIDNKLKQNFPGYKLIDYGIMALSDPDDE